MIKSNQNASGQNASGHDVCANALSLIDWRSEMAALYHKVSAASSLADIWQFFIKERKRLYDTHQQSPMQEHKSIAFFDYDPSFCFEVSLTPIGKAMPHTVDGGNDGVINFQPIALTSGLKSRLVKELTIYQLNHYGGGLFLPFCDGTNQSLSYGGGRYFIDTAKSAWLGVTENRVRLDFNFSYFPSCAHNDRFVCPLSPQENRLPIEVTAGERWDSAIIK